MALNIEIDAPQEIKAFRREIKYHPELYKKLKTLDTFSDIVVAAAGHVGLTLHGAFSEQEVLIIVDRIVDLLQKRRQLIITR